VVDFGKWLRDAMGARGAGGSSEAAGLFPFGVPLRQRVPRLAEGLEGPGMHTPIRRFAACVGGSFGARPTLEGGGAAEPAQSAQSAGRRHKAHGEEIWMDAGAGGRAGTRLAFDAQETFLLAVRGTIRLQLLAPGSVDCLYPFPAPSYDSSAVPPFSSEREPPIEFPAYANARPLEIELREGEMIYVPSHWYMAMRLGGGGGGGGGGATASNLLTVGLRWRAPVHPEKWDGANGTFVPLREVRSADAERGRSRIMRNLDC
jgi:hypothetical protein